MAILHHVALFALRPLANGAARALGVAVADEAVGAVVAFLVERFTDHSQQLTEALQRSSDRAWRALEIALAGESLLSRLDRQEDKAFRDELRQFLTALPAHAPDALDPAVRTEALRELRAVRKAGLLDAVLEPTELARRAGPLARHRDPAAILQSEWELLGELAAELRSAKYLNLAQFLMLRPAGDAPLLVISVRYFFRREIEQNAPLFQGLAFAQIEGIGQHLEIGFAAVHSAMSVHGERVEAMLANLHMLAAETHANVLDIRAELARHGQHLQDLGAAVQAALRPTERPVRVEESAMRPSEPPEEPVGPEERCFRGHAGPVACLAISPDGSQILSGSEDCTLRLWDVAIGREIRCLSGHKNVVCCVAFTAEGRRALSSGTDQSVRLWDLNTGRELRGFDRQTNRGVALSADGKLAVTGSVYDGMLKLWDAATGKEIRRLKGHMDWLLCLAFSPDGGRILSGSQDGTMRLWEADTGKQLRCFPSGSGAVTHVAFSPDGQRALCGGDRLVRLWDLRTGREVVRLMGHTGIVSSVAFSPDGQFALSGGHDATARLWNLSLGKELASLPHRSSVTAVGFLPDRQFAFTGCGDSLVRLWRLPGSDR